MPLTAMALTDILLERLRDTGAQATSRALCRTILSQAQVALNLRLESVLDSDTLAVPVGTNFFPIFANLPEASRILGVTHLDRELIYVSDWRDVLRRGLSRLADAPEVYCLPGRDLLVLYPALRRAGEVEVTYVKRTDDFAAEGTLSELTDEHLPKLLDMAEAMLLVRTRDLQGASRFLGEA